MWPCVLISQKESHRGLVALGEKRGMSKVAMLKQQSHLNPFGSRYVATGFGIHPDRF